MRPSIVAAVICGCLAWPVGAVLAGDVDSVSEADKHTARKLVESGDEKFRNGDYEAALNDYRGADTIMGVPTTGIEVARTLATLGRLLEAKKAYQRVSDYPEKDDEPEAFSQAREKARAGASELAARIPSVTVDVKTANGEAGAAVVSVDGAAATVGKAMELDPGPHTVDVSAVGFRSESQNFTLVEGDQQRITVLLRKLEAPAPVTPAPRPVERSIPFWTWIGVGFAGAGVVVGAVTGGLSLSKASELQDLALTENTYPESARPLQEDSVALAHVSTVSFAVAGAGAAVAALGILLYFVADDTPVTVESGMLTVSF